MKTIEDGLLDVRETSLPGTAFRGVRYLTLDDIALGPDHIQRLTERLVDEMLNKMVDEMTIPGSAPSISISIRVDGIGYSFEGALDDERPEETDTPEFRAMIAAGAERAEAVGQQPHLWREPCRAVDLGW